MELIFYSAPFLDPRPSPCSRLLYTILPAPYTQSTLNDLLRSWVEDLNKLAEDGITVLGQRK